MNLRFGRASCGSSPVQLLGHSLIVSLLLGVAGCAAKGQAGESAPPTEPATASASGQQAKPAQNTPEDPRAEVAARYAKIGYRMDWVGFATVLQDEKIKFLDTCGDLIVLQDSGSAVTAMSASTGLVKWSTMVATPLTAFVGNVRDGRSIISSSDHTAFFIDAESGQITDRQSFAKVISTPPAQVGPLLIYGTSVGEVLAHMKTNGFRAWGYLITGAVEAAPVPIGATSVGVVSQTGQVLIFNAASGVAEGRAKIFGGVACQLAASNELMFVASLDQSLYAFEKYGGVMRWRKRTNSPLRESPVYSEGRVYVSIPAVGFSAIDASNGKDLWTAKNVSGVAVVQSKGRIVVWNGSEATLLDAANGDIVDRVKLPDAAILKADTFKDGNLYTVTSSGEVHRLVVRDR